MASRDDICVTVFCKAAQIKTYKAVMPAIYLVIFSIFVSREAKLLKFLSSIRRYICNAGYNIAVNHHRRVYIFSAGIDNVIFYSNMAAYFCLSQCRRNEYPRPWRIVDTILPFSYIALTKSRTSFICLTCQGFIVRRDF